MKRIRIRARWTGVWYPVFSGLVEGWPQDYPGVGKDSVVALRCVDLFKVLALQQLDTSYSAETTGARIGNVLTTVGWPVADRDLDAGQSTVAAVTLDGINALNHLQEVAQSENGLFFIAADGLATLIDRHALILTSLDAALTWGDSGAEKPYLAMRLDPGDGNLWNQVKVTATGLAKQVGNNTASQDAYFTRTLQRATVLSSESQMQDLANFLATRFAQPLQRITDLVVQSSVGGGNWPSILDREIGDKIRVKRRPMNVGTVITQDSVVEGIAFTARPGDWKVTWSLSPVDSVSNYWVLDDAVQSILDSTTILAY